MLGASGRSSTVRSACSRAIGIDVADRGAVAPIRATRAPAPPAGSCPGLAVDRRRHEPGCRERRRRQRDGVGKSSGMCDPSSWSNIRMTIRRRRVELHRGERGVEVGEVVVAGHDDRRRRSRRRPGSGRGSRESPTTSRTPAVRQVFRGVVVGADPTTSSSRIRSSSMVRRPRWSSPQTMTWPVDSIGASLRLGGAPGVVATPRASRRRGRRPGSPPARARWSSRSWRSSCSSARAGRASLRGVAQSRRPVRQLITVVQVAESLGGSDVLGLPGLGLRPWKRMMARSEVTRRTGGTLLLKPCGSSTITNGMFGRSGSASSARGSSR